MPAAEWSAAFTPLDDAGKPLSPEKLPLMIALATRRPAYRKFVIRGLDGVLRPIEVAAIPIIGLQDEFLGAAALSVRPARRDAGVFASVRDRYAGAGARRPLQMHSLRIDEDGSAAGVAEAGLIQVNCHSSTMSNGWLPLVA